MKAPVTTPAYIALCERAARLREQFDKTELALAVRGLDAALKVWMSSDSADARKWLRAADEAVEREALCDPPSARLYAEITTLNLQIQSHRRALGITGNETLSLHKI